jgi:hypothetical protein
LYFEEAIVGAQSLEKPRRGPLQFAALGETLPADKGELPAVDQLTTKWSPPGEARFPAGLLANQPGPDSIRLMAHCAFKPAEALCASLHPRISCHW